MAKLVYIYTPLEKKKDWKNQRYMNSGYASRRDPYQIWNSLSHTPNGLNQDSKESRDIKVAWEKREFLTNKDFILRNNADSKNICQSLRVVMVIIAACYSYKLAASLPDLTQWKEHHFYAVCCANTIRT